MVPQCIPRAVAAWSKRVAAALLLAVMAMAILLWVRPYDLPDAAIARWLGMKLPANASIVSVRTLIERQHWQTIDEWVFPDGSRVEVLLGREWLRRRYVVAVFLFDRFGRFAGLYVRKSRQDAGAP